MAVIITMTAIVGWAIGTERISYVVTYGVSMNPVYHQDDLVFVVKRDSYHVGDIAAFHGSTPGLKVLHRIIGGNGTDGFVLKGDNNRSIDTQTPTADELIGRAVLHVPNGGVWLKPLLSPTGLGMMGFLIVSSGTALPRNRRELPRGRRKKRVKAMARQGNSWATAAAVLKAIARLSLPLRAVAVLGAAFFVTALLLGLLGWMKPVTERLTESGLRQSVAYSYSTKVPRTPVYDGTTVTSPDPIFRKVAKRIDLRLRYSGPAGSLEVSAVLSNSSGWHTTVPLASPRKFTGPTTESTVSLNLDAFDNRAKEAARAIGIASASTTVTVQTRVTAADLPVFTAPLVMTLSPLQLTLSSGESSLLVENSSDATETLVARHIGAFGWNLMTAAAARSWAAFLLIIALCCAAAVLWIAHREVPVRTRADIERRFPQLLVHVEPMASPPGKPVVNVDNFPALVKLAERYGQMILTWRRPDADDFVVRDEGITYRYRIPLDEPVLQNIEHLNRPSGMRSHRRKANQEVS